jgi:hypothetical protein
MWGLPFRIFGKRLTDPARGLLALEAAAYLLWAETRSQTTMPAKNLEELIQRMLERDGFAYRPSDIQMIAVVAVGSDIDAIQEYASRRNLFAELDRDSSRRWRPH